LSAVLGAPEDISLLLPKELAGEPGTRAPHVAVTFSGWKISTIETCTDCASCCLLAGANGAAWISAAERVMQRLGVPLSMYIYRFRVELAGAEVVAAAAHRLETDGALLVRPNGFVAWRTDAAAEDPERTLERFLCRLLCAMHRPVIGRVTT
jgi:putative polyketide hydroxylase